MAAYPDARFIRVELPERVRLPSRLIQIGRGPAQPPYGLTSYRVPGMPDAVFRRDGHQRLAEAGHGRKQKQ
jgi:hypothetical protein